MVDVGEKDHTKRVAVAASAITMKQATFDLIRSGQAKKGDVLATARIAGIMAAKQTHMLIPLCHPLSLTKVSVDIEEDDTLPGFAISATVQTTGQTGVEMEAMTAASIAALTIYDMVKAVDRGMVISYTRVIEKSGGKSGTWRVDDEPDEAKS